MYPIMYPTPTPESKISVRFAAGLELLAILRQVHRMTQNWP